MKAEVAVATVSGKAYYLIVDALKARNVPFISIKPGENVPVGIKVVITTDREQQLVDHERTLVYREGVEPETLVSRALQISQGKEYFERIVVGVDPGEVFGVAVLADGKIVETYNCFSIDEALRRIRSIVENSSTHAASVSVKIGDGVPDCKERLLHVLDECLALNVMLESVGEAGTNRCGDEAKHRRGLRDIVSAIKIAGRNGRKYQRGKTNESDS